ncbi:MAG: HEAT repeat domain-containing protein [Phycisphaerales bacterium]|nr:HEAT repeat domain-containing protein [Phycisphaerales bacterium]
MATPERGANETGAACGVARCVRSLERLWTSVRNYGVEHVATQRAADDAREVFNRAAEGDRLTLRVTRHHFVDGRDATLATPSELAERLYNADIAAVTILVDELKTCDLTQLIDAAGCRSLDEATERIGTLIASGSLGSITLLRMRFDGLCSTPGGDGLAVWDQLVSQVLHPAASTQDARPLVQAIESAIQHGASGLTGVREMLAHATAQAREAPEIEAPESLGRLRSVIAQLQPETRSALLATSPGAQTPELDHLAALIDVLPLEESITCLQHADITNDASAGVRMVQRMARVASSSSSSMRDIAEVAARWATDAETSANPHADALREAARLLQVGEDQAYNPAEYDQRLGEIASALETKHQLEGAVPEDPEATLQDHIALGLELLQSPEEWESDRVAVVQEMGAVFSGEATWDESDLLALVERMAQIRITGQSRETRTEANALLERVLASPQGLAAFVQAGTKPEAQLRLSELASASVPAAIDLLARLSRQAYDDQTHALVRSCIDRLDSNAIRDRIAQAIGSGGGGLEELFELLPRLQEGDVRTLLGKCVVHHDSGVRAMAIDKAQRVVRDVPVEWLHAGMRDEEPGVRRAVVRALAQQGDDAAAELLTLHVLGDIASTRLDAKERCEATEAIAGLRTASRERCLLAIVVRGLASPPYIASGAPALAALRLRNGASGLRARLALGLWAVNPMRIVFRPKRRKDGR